MITTANLLHEAYLHLKTGNERYSSALLESLLSIEPLNTEAWEASMQICQTCDELDYLCERVLQVKELPYMDRESVLDYYYYLRQKLRTQVMEADPRKTITFELVDQFTYVARDQNPSSSNTFEDQSLVKWGPAGLLEKAIIVLYLGLLMTGLKLLFIGIQFGYWILLVLALSFLISSWNIVFPRIKAAPDSRRPYPNDNRAEASRIVP
jgi:hypothetical protein